MNARIINLRTRRKQKARDQKRTKGDRNAAASGQSGAERDLTAARAAQDAARLDGHRIEPPSEPETPDVTDGDDH